MRLGVKIAIAFVLGMLIIGTVGIQSYLGIQRLTERNQWVIHTHEVMENLEHVISLLKDAETGQRGFVLTGDERYLDPYNSAIREIKKTLDSVTSLTKDSPEQQDSLQQLRKLSLDKLSELEETIEIRRKAGMEAALPVIRSDRGKRIMDEIRALVAQLDRREEELLDVRNRAANEAAQRSMVTLGFGVLLSLLVLGVAAVIATRTMRLADSGPMSNKDADRKWPRIAIRYAFAVAVVGIATWLRAWLVRSFGPMPLFVTWYPAVLAVAIVAGGGPGVVATLLSALAADYWFIEPFGRFSILAANDAVATGIFTATGIFLSILAERLHRARLAEAVSATQERELALQNMGNLIALDLDHRIVRWSDGNRRLYGFDAEEAQGQLADELLQTQFGQPLEQLHGELIEKGHWEEEVPRRRKDGTDLLVAIMWALRRDERGQPIAILEVSTDATERKRAEEALRASEERFRTVVENMSEGLMLFDAQGMIYQNPASLRIHGFRGQEEMRTGHKELPTTWEGWDETGRPIPFEEWPVSRVLRHERFQDQVLRAVRVDTGHEFYASYNGSPILGADGKLTLGFITIRDITERKQAEKERDRVFEYSLDMLSVAGFDGHFKRVSPSFEKTLGWSEAELLSKPLFDFIHPDDREATLQAAKAHERGMQAIRFENRYRCKDGSYKWISWNSHPVVEEQLIVSVARDITERKRAEEALRQQTLEL